MLKKLNLFLAWLNPAQKSVLIPIAVSFLLTTIFGSGGAAWSCFLSLILPPIIFLRLSKIQRRKWKRYLLSLGLASISFLSSFVVTALTFVTTHQILVAAYDGIVVAIYGPTTGANTRRYANKVIATVTTKDNANSLQVETRFLLGASQYKWLNAIQRQQLTKKSEAIATIVAGTNRDNSLLSQLRAVLNGKLTPDNYKEIIATADLLSKSPRFNVLVGKSDRNLLAERRSAATKVGEEIEKQRLLKKRREETIIKTALAKYIQERQNGVSHEGAVSNAATAIESYFGGSSYDNWKTARAFIGDKLTKYDTPEGEAIWKKNMPAGKWTSDEIDSIANNINAKIERVAKKGRDAIAAGYSYQTARQELIQFIRSIWSETIRNDGPTSPNREIVESLMQENLDHIDDYLDRRNN